jgi:hypothetical protein
MCRTEATVAAIEKIKEQDFKYITIKSYDPKIWKITMLSNRCKRWNSLKRLINVIK